jgi:transcriptional regulator with XRE-family HTH domain
MTPLKKQPPLKKRMLGELLRNKREVAGMRITDAAQVVGLHFSRLSHIESGTTNVTADRAEALLSAYGVTDAVTISQARSFADDPCKSRWYDAYGVDLLPGYRDLVELENLACDMSLWEPLVLPGLLQTHAYIRSFEANPDTDPYDLERFVLIRAGRKSALTSAGGKKRIRAMFPQALLYRDIGGSPAIRRDQLFHLIDLAELSSMELRVLPDQGGPTHAPAYSLNLFELPQPWPSCAYHDTHSGGLIENKDKEVGMLKEKFARLWATCLTQEETMRLIKEAVLEAMKEV